VERVGRVFKYYARPGVASIEASAPIARGDRLFFAGHTTQFEAQASSLEIDHAPVSRAQPGQRVGVKVEARVRPGDLVFRLDRGEG